MTTQTRTLTWPHGALAVSSLGGMIGPAVFVLPDGRQVSPLHIAPWWNEPASQSLDGMHRNLRGEWPCVPFGCPVDRDAFPDDWQGALPVGDHVDDVHGFSSNHDWTFLTPQGQGEVVMEIRYPADHPVESLQRRIRPGDGAGIALDLVIKVKRDCSLPIALHWCFALPPSPGDARLRPGAFQSGATYPASLAPGAEIFAPARRFSGLDQVPGRHGQAIDATALPFEAPIEELLQLNGTDGSFSLTNRHGGYRVDLRWDAAALPDVLLWYSNGGRQFTPWSGRNYCIGIEPCRSAFAMSPATCAQPNPLSRAGVPTSLDLRAGQAHEITYSMDVCAPG